MKCSSCLLEHAVVRLRVPHSFRHCRQSIIGRCFIRGRFNREYLAVWWSTRWPYTNTNDDEQLACQGTLLWRRLVLPCTEKIIQFLILRFLFPHCKMPKSVNIFSCDFSSFSVPSALKWGGRRGREEDKTIGGAKTLIWVVRLSSSNSLSLSPWIFPHGCVCG